MPVLMTLILGGAIAFMVFASARPGSRDALFMPKVGGVIGEGTKPKASKASKAHHDSCGNSVHFRRRLAATVAEVQREIQLLAGKSGVISAKWSIKLASVAEELDPRISLSEMSTWDFSARLPDMLPPNVSTDAVRHVCPEVFWKSKGAIKYNRSGMVTEKCKDVPEFGSVLTALLPAETWKAEDINFVVKQIRHYYDIPIVAMVSNRTTINTDVPNLRIENIEEDQHGMDGKSLNTVLESIQTPYVLFGTSLIHFNDMSSLERLVRVLDDLDHVHVVGGAARDPNGRWMHGCLQQRMADYKAQYKLGYSYSKYECMYCDDLLTPFVTTTNIFKKVPLSKDLIGNALFRDWFAKMQVTGNSAMACPDVMFFVSSHPEIDEKDWLAFSKQWSLEKIATYDNKEYTFSCSSVGISCKKPLEIIKSYLLPPCCRAEMEKYLSYLTDYGQKNNLAYELQAGSALGALKMDGYLPWDYDMDLIFECKDYNAWLKIGKTLKSKHCGVSVNRKGVYLTVHCPYFFLELYCNNATSKQHLPREYQNTPTTIKYAGKDVVVIANPGLHCRNKMGLEYLKHAAHWRTLKVTDLGKAKGGYDNPGVWNPCKKPTHQACLDHYPGEGNLPFKEPFLHL